MKSNKNAMYEDVIQQIIKKKEVHIDFENITSLPWVEIDFKKDLILAKKIILKQINE
jgi:choline kinase